MTADRRLSRRDFLRLRRTERGKVLELSCRALYMRCADAEADVARDAVAEWEPWMGEPPAVVLRRSPEELVAALAEDLQTVQVLKLIEPQWLDAISVAERVSSVIASFRTCGGVVEIVDESQ